MLPISPAVTVLIANYNGAKYVRPCLLSATQQTIKDIEIVFVDDASTDDSLAIASELAADDPRIRIIAKSENSGPGAARNAGLAAARGSWLAILDSDDMMEPERLAVLMAEAKRSQAQICADDLLVFGEKTIPHAFMREGGGLRQWITTNEFIRSGRMFSPAPSMGYLKPFVDLQFVKAHGIKYNTALPIGEDFDFILQLLLRGARYKFIDRLGYFYRKHTGSISHRIRVNELERMLLADKALTPLFELNADAPVFRARQQWRRSIERAISFSNLIAALKQRHWVNACGIGLSDPRALPLLSMPIKTRLRRIFARSKVDLNSGRKKTICVISRQRIVGSTNGSSAYVIALCAALRSKGCRLRLISPSPEVFGRWPYLHLADEMGVFDEVYIRGAIRVGRRLFIARNPRVLLAAIAAVLEGVCNRTGLLKRRDLKAFPYSIALPWRREDLLFVARHANGEAHAVIADYAFQTPAIAYALSPTANTAVVMHDLFCRRQVQFERLNASDSVAALDETSEFALLSRAGAVVAIQANEAATVAKQLPEQRVILAPMAASAIGPARPGNDRTVLFVGSNTAPNRLGLLWFLEAVWPSVADAIPSCEFIVAGGVTQGMSCPPGNVRYLGVVPDLAPLYQTAGVVISPLTAGSGLKVKLIEALGQGKAVVATSVTVEGVADTVSHAVTVADNAKEFGAAIVDLLQDEGLRRRKCEAALYIARQCFSPDSCYEEFAAYVADEPRRPVRQRSAQSVNEKSHRTCDSDMIALHAGGKSPE